MTASRRATAPGVAPGVPAWEAEARVDGTRSGARAEPRRARGRSRRIAASRASFAAARATASARARVVSARAVFVVSARAVFVAASDSASLPRLRLSSAAVSSASVDASGRARVASARRADSSSRSTRAFFAVISARSVARRAASSASAFASARAREVDSASPRSGSAFSLALAADGDSLRADSGSGRSGEARKLVEGVSGSTLGVGSSRWSPDGRSRAPRSTTTRRTSAVSRSSRSSLRARDSGREGRVAPTRFESVRRRSFTAAITSASVDMAEHRRGRRGSAPETGCRYDSTRAAVDRRPRPRGGGAEGVTNPHPRSETISVPARAGARGVKPPLARSRAARVVANGCANSDETPTAARVRGLTENC